MFFRYIFERTDDNHLINKLNINGFNPLYLAAQNGNLNVFFSIILSQILNFLYISDC